MTLTMPMDVPGKVIPFSQGGLNGLCHEGMENFDLAAVPFDRLARREKIPGFELIKSTRSRCTIRMEFKQPDGQIRRLYVKRYRTWRFLRKIAYLFIPSKAMLEWRLGHDLVHRGIMSPPPLLVAEERAGLFIRNNFLITCGIEPYQSVYSLIQTIHEHTERRRFIAALAHYIHRVHDAGFYHDDMSSEHIFAFIEENKTDFALIDLDNGRVFRKVSQRRRIKNLFQILRSLDERQLDNQHRLFFLQEYLGEPVSSQFIDEINGLALRKTGAPVLPDAPH